MPMSYSFSGHLVVVPRRNVKKIDRSSVDIMKYVVSGGIVEIDAPDDHIENNPQSTNDKNSTQL
jgi:uncharacterized membrane protein